MFWFFHISTPSHSLEAARPSVWKTIESTFGAFFAFVLGFVVVVLGGWMTYESRQSPDFWWLLLVYGVTAAGECTFLLWLKWSLEKGLHPIAPRLAARQHRWPVLLRPLLAAWWGAHYLAAAVGLIIMERSFSFAGMSSNGIIAFGTVYLGALFTIAHSAILYLLLAISAVHRSEMILWRVWKWRIVIDTAVTVVGAVVAWR